MSVLPQTQDVSTDDQHKHEQRTIVPQTRWYTHALVHLLLLSFVVLLTYWGMWRAYFATLDDFGITGWVRSRATLWVAMQGYGSGVRFLNYVPIWFKSQWFGLDAAPYLWSGLAQYLVVVWLVYALVQQISKRWGLSLLAALLFALSYTHYEVVTYVSASDYTWWAAVYLAVVVLFLRHVEQGNQWSYWGAVVAYGCLALGHDFTLNVPLVLVAVHAILYFDWQRFRTGNWAARRQQLRQALRYHLPFWLLWATHVMLQFRLVVGGTSEAVYSENGYAPGIHMIANLRYLIFLWVPNMTLGPIYSFLSERLSIPMLDLLWQLSLALGILLHLVLIWAFWKGNGVVRVAVALIYLPFLQYTPWQGHFIEAPRYLLLPSVGGALLLACGVTALWQQPIIRQRQFRQALVVAAVALFCLANVAVVQVWVQQHVANGHFRRGFVTALETEYLDLLGPDALVWIEVPEEKYTDLADACRLVFQRDYVPCVTYVAGDPPPSDRNSLPAGRDFYQLQATAQGIVQHYPPTDE